MRHENCFVSILRIISIARKFLEISAHTVFIYCTQQPPVSGGVEKIVYFDRHSTRLPISASIVGHLQTPKRKSSGIVRTQPIAASVATAMSLSFLTVRLRNLLRSCAVSIAASSCAAL